MTRLRRPALALLALLLVAACGPMPAATPDDMVGVLNELTAHGATVTDIIAGDAGCPASSLHSNGSHLKMRFSPDGRDYDVYLFRWRGRTDFDSAAAQFDQCKSEFGNRLGPALPVSVVEVAPWRAFGIGWPSALRDAIEQSLVAAASGG